MHWSGFRSGAAVQMSVSAALRSTPFTQNSQFRALPLTERGSGRCLPTARSGLRSLLNMGERASTSGAQ